MPYFELKPGKSHLTGMDDPLKPLGLKTDAEQYADDEINRLFALYDITGWATTVPTQIARAADFLGSGYFLASLEGAGSAGSSRLTEHPLIQDGFAMIQQLLASNVLELSPKDTNESFVEGFRTLQRS